ASRKVTVHVLGVRARSFWAWFYFPELHSVVALGERGSYAVDLATGEPQRHVSHDQLSPRAARALMEAEQTMLPPPYLHIFDPDGTKFQTGPAIDLNTKTGTVRLSGVSPAWQPFTPLADGLPVLKGCAIDCAQLQGSTLAVKVRPYGSRDPQTLRVFRGP